jgi:hypothetical protein
MPNRPRQHYSTQTIAPVPTRTVATGTPSQRAAALVRASRINRATLPAKRPSTSPYQGVDRG